MFIYCGIYCNSISNRVFFALTCWYDTKPNWVILFMMTNLFMTNDSSYKFLQHISWNKPCLSHWGQDKMDAISQTTFSSVFSWIKIFEFWLRTLKFVPNVRINNIPALVQIMAWGRTGDKPLSEPVMVNSVTHICVTQPQWVNHPLKRSMSGLGNSFQSMTLTHWPVGDYNAISEKWFSYSS